LSPATGSRGRSVPDWLLWRATASPRALAVKAGPLEWSFLELQEKVSSLSAALLSRGVARGDRVAILMSPSEGYVALAHALARIGAVGVPLNHRQSAPELSAQLRDSGPSLVVHDEALGPGKRPDGGPSKLRWATFNDLMADSSVGGREPVAGDTLDLASAHVVVYTSGSTGDPKGVELTLSNLMWNAVSVGFRTGASEEDRWLLCMPLFHVGGYSIIFRSVLHGSGIIVHDRFDAGRVSRSLDDDAITMASFVPTMLSEVLEARGGKPLGPRLRVVFLGGGPPPAQLLAVIRKRRLPVLLTYGMTETCSQVALSDPRESSGRPVYRQAFPSEVAVVKAGTGRGLSLAGPGEAGEVAVRGPTLFRGYWRMPSATRARFKGKWFLTGDLGVLQEGPSGGIAILGRKEETIVSGGEKVYPAEVESSLREHPAVMDVVVVGVEDEKWGQMVVAVLETRPGVGRPSEAELSAFLRERVGGYKVPKRYRFWPALPRTPTGKTRREEVRARLARGEGPS
jgi:o-succinylbenzoate---CoA ligase